MMPVFLITFTKVIQPVGFRKQLIQCCFILIHINR